MGNQARTRCFPELSEPCSEMRQLIRTLWQLNRTVFMIMLFFACSRVNAAEQTLIDDYLSSRTVPDNARIYRLDLNLGDDATTHTFISDDGIVNGRSGLLWFYYKWNASDREAYVLTVDGEAINFRADAYMLKYIEDKKTTGIITFFPGGGQIGHVDAWIPVPAGLRRHSIGTTTTVENPLIKEIVGFATFNPVTIIERKLLPGNLRRD